MTRILAVLFAIMCAAPVLAETLPPGLDPQNTLYLDTKYGRVIIKLNTEVAPLHAERLKLLAREHFYDNVPFHRVIDGFMAQTGDGKYGNGTGGSKYPDLKAEFSKVPFKRGTVGMARASNPNSANSQFFIMFADGSFLNGQYTVVGEVVRGMDAVDKLKKRRAAGRSRPHHPYAGGGRRQAVRQAVTIHARGRQGDCCGLRDDRPWRPACGEPNIETQSSAAGARALQRLERTSLSSVILRRVPSRPVLSL